MTDPHTRIAEIRQENRGGDVSYDDIAWLLDVAEAAAHVAREATIASIRHLQRTLVRRG